MTDCLVEPTAFAMAEPLLNIYPRDLHTLLAERRSIRRLRSGPFPLDARDRLLEAIRLTPAAFNLPPWHVVLVQDQREAFWHTIERAFRDRLDEDRLERYLDRLAGFWPAVAVALVYEDTSVRAHLRDAWNISDEQAAAFAQQGLGMLQLALWLSVTGDGLVTSLQHWDWLAEDRIAEFVGIDRGRYKLAAALPIGYPDEPARPVERTELARVVSLERVAAEPEVVLR